MVHVLYLSPLRLNSTSSKLARNLESQPMRLGFIENKFFRAKCLAFVTNEIMNNNKPFRTTPSPYKF